jgi:hypothetical protein
LTYGIVKLWSAADLDADQRKTSREAGTAVQHLLKTWGSIPTTVDLSEPQRIVTYHFRLYYSHKTYYITIWHALFRFLFLYTYRQSGYRWHLHIIGGEPSNNDGASEPHILRQSGSSLRSVGMGRECMIRPGVKDPRIWVDPGIPRQGK